MAANDDDGSFDMTPEERDHLVARRESESDKPAGKNAEDRVATVGDIKRTLNEAEQAAESKAMQREVQVELDAAIDGPIKANEKLADLPAHRRADIHREAITRVRALPNSRQLSRDQLKSELTKASEAVIAEDFEFHGAKVTADKKADLDKRLEAAAKVGETGGSARSAGEGSPDKKTGVAGMEIPEFGPYPYPGTLPNDAELDMIFQKEADKLMASLE